MRVEEMALRSEIRQMLNEAGLSNAIVAIIETDKGQIDVYEE